MENIPLKNKPLFVGLSCMSAFCLVSSFAYPLQKLEVWRQNEIGAFGIPYEKNFIVTENDRDYPYGFNPDKAKKIAQVYKDYKIEKIIWLVVAVTAASFSLYLGNEVCRHDEVSREVEQIKWEGKKQLILEGVRHRLALASRSQRLVFLDEIKVMMEEFGSPEAEIMELDERLIIGGNEDIPEDTPKFRELFPENLDAPTCKAIAKAISDGLEDDEIVTDILGCGKSEMGLGKSYLDYLRQRFEIA